MGLRELTPEELGLVKPLRGLRELTPEEVQQVKPLEGFGAQAVRSVGEGFNRGLTNVAGFPVDAINAVSRKLGLPSSPTPIGGSQSLRELFGALNIQTRAPKELPVPMLGRISEEIGGAAVPFGAFGAFANRTGNIFTKPILEAFRRSPRSNAALEATAAGGAGFGAGIAQEIAPDNDTAEMVGQLLGGFASPVAAGAKVAAAGSRGARKVADPLLPGGAERSAARQLQRIVKDPERAARALEGPQAGVPGSKLTPAQETQDVGLLRLERALINNQADIEGRFDEAAEATRKALEAEGGRIGGDVPIERTREFFEARLQRLGNALDARSAQAVERAAQRVRELDPTTPPTEASRIVRDEIEGALADAQLQEKALFDAIPEQAAAPTRTLKMTYSDIMARRRKSDDPFDVPEYVHKLLGGKGFADVESIGELQTFRSRLLRSAREERARPASNRRKLDILRDLQTAALEDMGALADDATGVGRQIKEALDFSRQLNERFRQGPVARVLGYESRGGVEVAPEETLARLLSNKNETGEVNLKALDEAFRDSPARAQQFRSAAEDYIKSRFVQQVTSDTGAIRPGLANRFLRNNQELLSRFPDLHAQLQRADQAQRIADDVVRRSGTRKAALTDKQRSRAALFLDAPVEREIGRVLRSRDPVGNMRQIVMQARRDPEGLALKGIKSQFVRDMLARAQIQGRGGEAVQEFFDGNAKVIRQSGLFSPDEVQRLRQIVDTARRLDRTKLRERGVSEVLDESPDALIDLVARITGANIGARGAAGSTGAPIVAAGAGSRFVRSITNRIPMQRTRDVLAQAVLDRDLMRTLLRKVKTPQEQELLQRQLNAFLVNLLPADDEAIQQDQQQ